MKIGRVKELSKKTVRTFREEGIKEVLLKAKNTVYKKNQKNNYEHFEFNDILFVNGCGLPHPQRYRVDHQIEQLEAAGLSCSKIYYDKVKPEMAKFYRAIVIYRCPIIPSVKELIINAKENNKVVFYDIDDLVFDCNDVKDVDAVKNMNKDEKKLYFDGVKRMGETLDLCDYGIASTSRLKIEMSKHLKEVFLNRNVASEMMVKCSKEALRIDNKDNDKIVIGYLSGSITHNADFDLIKPVLLKILQKYDNVYLRVAGFLDIPDEFNKLKDKIIMTPFVDWQKLPEIIHSLDINIAPLENTVFNEAKSENKWTEAALVKVPTIASNVGAFKETIVHGKTGILCDDNADWLKYLEELINDAEYRNYIAQNAYEEVMKYHTTINTGVALRDFIVQKLHRNFCFVLPSINISGGILVAIKHAQILKKNGYDVTLLNAQNNFTNIKNNDGEINVIPVCLTEFKGYIDTIIATMWLTLDFAEKYYNCGTVKYLVQGYETNFYSEGDLNRLLCESTYNRCNKVEYITISKWCQQWLTDTYKKSVKYAPNGIDLSIFKYKERKFKGKIKILIEGNHKDCHKNVDESFKIVDKLNKDKFEIHYLSYDSEPKKTYYFDKFYHKVSHDEVGKIYQSCDILIKTSLLESFSYPPIEMMATGGICLAIENCGNREYLKDRVNCLMYKQGNIDEAVNSINEICDDKNLRNKIIKNGLDTAKARDWINLEKEVLKLYE